MCGVVFSNRRGALRDPRLFGRRVFGRSLLARGDALVGALEICRFETSIESRRVLGDTSVASEIGREAGSRGHAKSGVRDGGIGRRRRLGSSLSELGFAVGAGAFARELGGRGAARDRSRARRQSSARHQSNSAGFERFGPRIELGKHARRSLCSQIGRVAHELPALVVDQDSHLGPTPSITQESAGASRVPVVRSEILCRHDSPAARDRHRSFRASRGRHSPRRGSARGTTESASTARRAWRNPDLPEARSRGGSAASCSF